MPRCLYQTPQIGYYIGDARLVNFLLAEADILILLEQSRRANIGPFLRRFLLRGKLEWALLKHYFRTLSHTILCKSHGDVFLVVMRVLYHVLNSYDLKPRNVILDEFNNPVIVDFDSCKPVGTSMNG